MVLSYFKEKVVGVTVLKSKYDAQTHTVVIGTKVRAGKPYTFSVLALDPKKQHAKGTKDAAGKCALFGLSESGNLENATLTCSEVIGFPTSTMSRC